MGQVYSDRGKTALANGPIHQKPKDKPRKQRIKSLLKRIAAEGGPKLIPFTIVIADLLDDGQLNGSILNMVFT